MIQEMLTPPERIGFIGIGAMGLPMATNLLKAGYKINVLLRSQNKKETLIKNGFKLCKTSGEVAKETKALLICVTNDEAVDMVLFGSNGALEEMPIGSLILNFSTISPDKSRLINSKLENLGFKYLDCPVSGGTEGANKGTLTIFAGGDITTYNYASQILDTLGGSKYHFGDAGTGQEVKAVNQILVAGNYAALAEAIALGESLELPMDQVISALQLGAASSWALKNRSNNMLNDKYPLGFKLGLHYKDLIIALNTARKFGLKLPVTSKILSIEKEMIDQGYFDEDLSVLRRYLLLNINGDIP